MMIFFMLAISSITESTLHNPVKLTSSFRRKLISIFAGEKLHNHPSRITPLAA
jgi:hypothetical protein